MRIVSIKSGHDASIAVIENRRLALSIESERDSFPRHYFLAPTAVLAAAALTGPPDVVAIGGWHHRGPFGPRPIAAGYFGLGVIQFATTFFGAPVRYFSSSHERSHVMMAVGLAPPADRHAVLVWEGDIGCFYLTDRVGTVLERIPVMSEPGARYALVYALADPRFPDGGMFPRLEDAGKLMALSAFARAKDADADIVKAVDAILSVPTCYPVPKAAFRWSQLYNVGVEAAVTKAAGALMTERIFTLFERAATERLPRGLPLRISGGCGLNCEWNSRWRSHEHFSSVFIPPCTDDSGSAIGTAIDALAVLTGDPHVDWDVYAGLEFEHDVTPPESDWRLSPLDVHRLAARLLAGDVVAWVQGRWEIGPRALGHRSLLAEPFHATSRERLNRIKRREAYRPIAPCCRLEDLSKCFDTTFHDPYMLYFRRFTRSDFHAVMHVDGSARVQTVGRDGSRLSRLLDSVAATSGCGMLCNTSLNFPGHGFINRTSDLLSYCNATDIDSFVIDDRWFERRRAASAA
jgi:hydroxymethyl cephem carbamoyltransferase